MVYEFEEVCLGGEPALAEDPPPNDAGVLEVSVERGKLPPLLRQTIAAMVLLVMLLCAKLWWPAGHRLAKQYLCGDTIGPGQAATRELLRDVASGVPIPEALSVFCQEVVYGTD